MSEHGASPFYWVPGQGPDPEALRRMADAFPRPKKAMGEAWFMGEDRRMYPELLGSLDELTDEQLTAPLAEIACGTSSFGRLEEWTEWYHYLLPRLLDRQWGRYAAHPAELLVTGFVGQHPVSKGNLPYPAFEADALATLGQYIMSPHFWQAADADVPKCLNKWKGPAGTSGWSWVEGLLSASLFLCAKYLSADLVRPWFQSAVSIPNLYWRAQVITWLVGAHPILTDEIGQPAQLPGDLHFGVGWEWSHALDGDYAGNDEKPIELAPFLPALNREAVLEVVREMDVEEFFEELLTDPRLEAVAAETAGLPDRFRVLYRNGAKAG